MQNIRYRLLSLIGLTGVIMGCLPLSAQDSQAGKTQFDTGWDWYLQGDYARAVEHLGQSAHIREQVVACDDSLLVLTCRYLASLTNYLHRANDALYWSKKGQKCASEETDFWVENLAIFSKVEGEAYRDLGMLDSAILALKRSLVYRKRLQKIYSIGVILNSMGSTFSLFDQVDSAVYYVHAGRDIFDAYPDSILRKEGLAITHTNLGLIFNQQLAYQEAIVNFQKSIAIKESLNNNRSLIAPLINLGISYLGLKQYEQAKRTYERATHILIDTGDGVGLERARILYHVAEIHLLESNLSQALDKINQAEDMFSQTEAAFEAAHTQVLKGEILQRMKQYPAAEATYLEAYRQIKEIYGEGSPQLALVSNHLAAFAKETDQWDKALLYNQLTFSQIGVSHIPDEVLQNPAYQDLIDALGLRAILQYHDFEQGKGDHHRDSALLYLDLGMEVLQRYGMNLRREDYMKLREQYNDLFKIGYEILIEGELTDPQSIATLFTIVEKAKAGIMRAQNAKRMAGADVGLSPEKEILLKQYTERGLFLSRAIVDAASKDSSYNRLLNSWQENQQDYQSLVNELKQDNQRYFQLKYESQVCSLDDLQESLQDDQALLEYIYLDSSTVMILISRDTAIVYQSYHGPGLERLITQLRTSILAAKENYPSQTSTILYIQKAHELYRHLWKPLIPYLEKINKVMIVPDGPLGKIPFDALLSKPVDIDQWKKEENVRSLPFLLKDYQVSFQFSATQWMYTTSNQPRSNLNLLAFAPDFTGRYSDTTSRGLAISPLRHNQSEAKTIAQIFEGKVMTGAQANLENFLSLAPHYGLIHVSTHGDSAGFLIFPDSYQQAIQLLYAKDIYALKLFAEMVVLSACETHQGPLQIGEGILNLAHAFTYAGSRSVISTQWAVDDNKTAGLMKAYYSFLQEGQDKDEALQSAKQHILQSEKYYPFYWAAFVPTGDMRPIVNPYRLYIRGGIILILILVVMTIGRYLMRKAKKS